MEVWNLEWEKAESQSCRDSILIQFGNEKKETNRPRGNSNKINFD